MFDSTGYDHTFNVFCICVSGLSAGRYEFYYLDELPLRPQTRHMAANTVDSISMFLTPASYAFLRYSSFSSWEKEQRAPSSRPWPAETQHLWPQDQLLWKTLAWHACDGRTFVEVVGAHGFSDHCGETIELRGALHELTGDPLIQLSAPGDDFPQHYLLKLRAEGVVHCFIRDHHRPWSQTYRRRQPRMSTLFLHKYFQLNKRNLTNSARCSQAKQHHIATLGVMQQFDELVQHDRDGRNTHSVLWGDKNRL